VAVFILLNFLNQKSKEEYTFLQCGTLAAVVYT